MRIPTHITGYTPVAILTGLYAAVWMALEGNLRCDLLLAALALALGFAYLGMRYLGGRTLPIGRAVVLATATGLAYGIGLALLTLFLMILKTGLHAHGPEYAAEEVAWVWGQVVIWAGSGALVGLGAGLLASAGRKNETRI